MSKTMTCENKTTDLNRLIYVWEMKDNGTDNTVEWKLLLLTTTPKSADFVYRRTIL